MSAHQSVLQEVKERAFPRFQCLRRKKIVAYHPAHYRSRGEIEHRHTYQRKNSLMRVHFAKVAGFDPILDQASKRSAEMVDQCFASRDYTEGRTAFMEKRKPVFTGT